MLFLKELANGVHNNLKNTVFQENKSKWTKDESDKICTCEVWMNSTIKRISKNQLSLLLLLNLEFETLRQIHKTNLVIKGAKLKWDETKMESRIRLKKQLLNSTYYEKFDNSNIHYCLSFNFLYWLWIEHCCFAKWNFNREFSNVTEFLK